MLRLPTDTAQSRVTLKDTAVLERKKSSQERKGTGSGCAITDCRRKSERVQVLRLCALETPTDH